MASESRTLMFFPMVFGNTMNFHQEFMRRLMQRLRLTEVNAEHTCDVIIAFVSVVSRAGTDIESALQKIPKSKPVVLVTLHFTFDDNYIAPRSDRNISRDDVFAVDLLCYEDLGLLRCLRNDEALKAVTDHLISFGATLGTQHDAARSQRRCSPFFIFLLLFFIFVLIAIVIGSSIYICIMRRPKHIAPTVHYNTTTNNTVNNKFN